MIAIGVYLMTGKNQHVVPHPEGWAVKGARNSKATAVYSTQKDAIARAEQIARNQGSDTKFMGKMEKFVLVIAMAMTLVRLKIKNKLIALYWMILRQTSSCSL